MQRRESKDGFGHNKKAPIDGACEVGESKGLGFLADVAASINPTLDVGFLLRRQRKQRPDNRPVFFCAIDIPPFPGLQSRSEANE